VRLIRILEEAAEEAAAAADWYESERAGLGSEFLNAVDAAIDLIEEDILPLLPLPGNAGEKGAKRLILKRFPYDIVVIERSSEVIVVAFAHHSRKPGYWSERFRRK
jgi:hypothetical protein